MAHYKVMFKAWLKFIICSNSTHFNRWEIKFKFWFLQRYFEHYIWERWRYFRYFLVVRVREWAFCYREQLNYSPPCNIHWNPNIYRPYFNHNRGNTYFPRRRRSDRNRTMERRGKFYGKIPPFYWPLYVAKKTHMLTLGCTLIWGNTDWDHVYVINKLHLAIGFKRSMSP